jgi:FixJ family two-component response regulator
LPEIPVVSIIDDDKSVRLATSRLVRSHGYRALAFASVEEFLKSEHLDETCCVITDVQMPGTTGIELQRWLRAHGLSLPIIFITAFPDENIRARALEGGAVGFLSKPFDSEKLIVCIDSALQKFGGKKPFTPPSKQ